MIPSDAFAIILEVIRKDNRIDLSGYREGLLKSNGGRILAGIVPERMPRLMTSHRPYAPSPKSRREGGRPNRVALLRRMLEAA